MDYATLTDNIVKLPEKICQKLGLKGGQILEIRGFENRIVLVPVEGDTRKKPFHSLDPIKHPKLFVGLTEGGLSFEIPPEKIYDFLCTLARALKPETIRIYYQEDPSAKEIACSASSFKQKLKTIGEFISDASLIIEYNGYTLYSGGEGCFSLDAALDAGEKRRIGSSILDMFGLSKDVFSDKFEIYYDGKNIEAY
ncbi:MAG: AbrB/MazE/SpoVT family DNA-binding domain-containing protein [Desulfobacterales bacterium]